MHRLIFVIIFFGFAALPARAGDPADLTVTVEGIANATGLVLVAVCTRDTFLGPDCPYKAKVAATSGGAVEVELGGIPPGTYAVQAFHDENGNFSIDRTILGMPEEGMGFSKNAPMKYGPPEFDKAAIEVKGGRNKTRFRLQYY